MATTHKPRRESIDPLGEFPFSPNDYVLHLVAAIHQFRDAALDSALRTLELNVGRYRVLGVLNRFGPTTMTELANFTAIERTTLTRIADHLVAAGFVERRDQPKDRRQVLLELTDSGRDIYTKALVEVFDLNRKLLKDVSDEAQRATARVLMGVVDNLAPNPAARDSIVHFSRKSDRNENS
jgi:DNA-binding MarR family transcriptional regulator